MSYVGRAHGADFQVGGGGGERVSVSKLGGSIGGSEIGVEMYLKLPIVI